MSHKNSGFVPGLIVFLALIIFFGGILWLSGKNIILSEDFRYYFEFPDVVGLHDKAPVYMRGYRVGWTKSVEFRGDVVRVTADIKKDFIIPEDSQVEITTLNFIGEKAVTIRPGRSDKPLEKGTVLRGENKDIMTLTQDILFKARAKVETADLDLWIRKVTESTDSVLDLVKTMRTRIDKMDVESYNLQIERLGRTSLEFQDFMDRMGRDTGRLSRMTEESLDKFQGTLDRVDDALARLTELSSEIGTFTRGLNRGEGTLGELAKNRAFFDSLNRTLEELNAFLADIKKNPKKYVKFSIF